MHIVHLNDAVAQDIAGGSRQYARQLARCMVASGHQVTFLVPKSRQEQASDEILEGSRILRYDANNPMQKFRALRKAFLQLHAAHPVDAAIVHFGYTGLAYHLLSVSKRIPTLRIFHGPWDRESCAEFGDHGWKNRLKLGIMFTIDRYSLHRSDHIVALSDFMAQDVVGRFRITRKKVSVIPGGVDSQRFLPGDKQAIRQRLKFPDNAFVVFTARRLVRRMGLDLLIKAVAAVGDTIPNLRVCIAGKGPLAGELQSLAEELGVAERIHLLGYITDETLIDYYRGADVFVLPSVAMEGFGLIILEALACNMPVLGTPIGAIPEVLSLFDPGLILREASPAAIAHGLIGAYETRGSVPKNYRKMIQDKYEWSAIASRVIAKLAVTPERVSLQIPAPQSIPAALADKNGYDGVHACVDAKLHDIGVRSPAVQERAAVVE